MPPFVALSTPDTPLAGTLAALVELVTAVTPMAPTICAAVATVPPVALVAHTRPGYGNVAPPPPPPPTAWHPVALPFGKMPVGEYPDEHNVGVEAKAAAVVAAMSPVPVYPRLAPLPTYIAAVTFVAPVNDENGNEPVVTALTVTAPTPLVGDKVMLVPAINCVTEPLGTQVLP